MAADDSSLARPHGQATAVSPRVRGRRAGDDIQVPARHELMARVNRHQWTLSPLPAIAIGLAAWTTVAFSGAGAAGPGGSAYWAAVVTLLAVLYAWACRRSVLQTARSGLLAPALLLAAAAIWGTGIAMISTPAASGEGRLLAALALAVAAVSLPALVARLELLLAVLAVLLLPLAVARLGGPGADLPVSGVLLVAGVLLAAGGAGLGIAFGRAVRNDVEQRTLLRRLEETNQALSADRVALQTESRTDALTGLANRRFLEETLQSEWNRCRRSGAPLSCVLLDIDHFKAYNDHYGHDGGDVCLRRIAAILSDSTRRAGDVVARYGGEEFVVLLPETGGDGATTVAELLKRAVVEAGIPHAKSPLGAVVTVSQGVATLVPDEERVPGELLKAADLALYEAKGAGRNRVVMADEEAKDSARMAARGLIG